uniref:Uncharacterized protein n=1 Tax=Stegastes partitus TaxID=144197 RepID=A0A3B5A125_9TELE
TTPDPARCGCWSCHSYCYHHCQCEINEPDGLFATWYHRANNKEEMNKALASKHTHSVLYFEDVCHCSYTVKE